VKVIVIGMGEVGKYVASVLAGEKHDVIIVDEDAAALAKAEEKMDVLALRGHGASMKTLREAKVDEADLVLGVTGKDEINLLAAITAKRLGAKRNVARVSNRDYLGDAERGYYHNLLGIDLVISVKILIANEIKRLIKSVGAIAVADFADNRVEMMQIAIEDELRVVEKPLRDIAMPDNCLVAAILRNETLIIPRRRSGFSLFAGRRQSRDSRDYPLAGKPYRGQTVARCELPTRRCGGIGGK
jgi:trk system potassium uptake protein TrkA